MGGIQEQAFIKKKHYSSFFCGLFGFFIVEFWPLSWVCFTKTLHHPSENTLFGIPGWCSGLAPAFGPGRDPEDPGSNPTLGSWCMEPASPSARVSASLCVCVTIIKQTNKQTNKKTMTGVNLSIFIISLNVNGLISPNKTWRLAEWIKTYDPTIFCQ